MNFIKKWFGKKEKKYEIREQNKFDVELQLEKEKLDAPFLIDEKRKHKGNPLIEFKNVYRYFGVGNNKITAVNDLTFTLYDGEHVALIGSNGAGKTTTVEMMAGINKCSQGQIIYHFGDNTKSPQQLIGIQFQDSSYPNSLKVKNILKFIIDVYKIDINPLETKKIVEAFGLKEFYDKSVRSLSGGQQQRLNILLALIHRPKIVILDELSTGLDISIRSKIINFIIEYCKRFNIKILLISHNMDEIELITDRIMIMQKGQLKVDMNKSDVIKKYNSIRELSEKYI